MRNCKEVVRLLASGEELRLLDKAELRVHLLMCSNCSRFAKQLRLMKKAFVNLFKRVAAVDKSVVKQLEDDVLKKVDK